MAYNPRDYFFKKAKEQNFAARSIFKLEEIDQRYKIIKKGDFILDLGASPGSWSQYCSKKIGPTGKILGIDLKDVNLTLPNAFFYKSDIKNFSVGDKMKELGFPEKFDVVLSDMAPSTTGIRLTDQLRSLELCEMAFETATQHLKPGGHFVCKLFHSGEFESFRSKIKSSFEKIALLKPKSTRKESKEIFFICLSFQI